MLTPYYTRKFAKGNVHTPTSDATRQAVDRVRAKLSRGEEVLIAGLGLAGHNSGVSLVRVSSRTGVELLSNDEEERFTGIKHFDGYPEQCFEVLRERLGRMGKSAADVDEWTLSWNYVKAITSGIASLAEELPASRRLSDPAAMPKWNFRKNSRAVRSSSARIARQFGLAEGPPLLMMPHHDNHAAFALLMSPFAASDKPVMVTVLDGFGDEGAISLYVSEGDRLKPLRKNESFFDSLGLFYSVISSTQGGWTTLSSEGRYMGAVAWGDQDRLTNSYYRLLRQIFYFAPDGEIHVNRGLANWAAAGELAPYRPALSALIGEPLPTDKMWNPDAVLKVEDVRHSEITRSRVDLAAATQLVFEDALFHIVDHLIRTTKSDRLVMSGGTALNCLGNMHLLERYDEAWYQRNLGMRTRLSLWVPPIPSDAGVPAGSACHFAMLAGAKAGPPMRHAFHCGLPPQTPDIEAALGATPQIGSRALDNIGTEAGLEAVADLMAYVIARDGVVGLYQGAAETGPRALGHRSILANPCNPASMENINLRVKYREPIRPLAPMATLEAARRFFQLSPGASDDDYNAYNYMVLTAQVRPEARERIPAVVHHDGTGRVQIVRPDSDPLTHAYLKAMGRRVGVEVSVNTSLNVGSPIVQSPEQALGALRRAKALTALVMIGEDGSAFLVWDETTDALKDGGRQLLAWYDEWLAEAAVGSGHAVSPRVGRISTPPAQKDATDAVRR